jgi:ATP-dependent exoDNAse (exonuclease V) beta subunit
MAELLDQYQERKRRQGKLDFVDLLCHVRDLIRNQRDARAYLQQRFRCLLVDEFQDTDPLQVEILLLLCADDPEESDWRKARPQDGKLFLVGDPKQSIYKFRRADLLLYRTIRGALKDSGVGCETLAQSYRAVPNIQQFVNAAFENEMSTDASEGHADWAELERFRPEIAGQPSVIALPVPRPYGKARLSKQAIAESLPDAIAAFIDWLLAHKSWRFGDSGEPLREKDIAVLFRKRNYGNVDLTRETVRALEARGIPHLLAGSKSFHRREEVETLRAALTAIEWPDDELSVFAMRSCCCTSTRLAVCTRSAFLNRPFSRRSPRHWLCWRTCIAPATGARSPRR